MQWVVVFFFFSSRRRHTISLCDWSSDVCSSDLYLPAQATWTGSNGGWRGVAGRLRVSTTIIAARELLLEPHIEHDEQVAAAHLLDFELRDTGRPVVPVDGHHRVGIASRHRFER